MKIPPSIKYVVLWIEEVKEYSPVCGQSISCKRKRLKKYKTKTGMIKGVDRAVKKCNEEGVAVFRVLDVVKDKLDMLPLLNKEGKYEQA